MKKLNINITKAQLTSFRVELKEGRPEVDMTIALLTDAGKVVTTYTVATDDWRTDSKVTLPLESMPLIGELASIFEGVVVRHALEGQLAIAAPKKATTKKAKLSNFGEVLDGMDVNVEDISTKPINLDDVPF